VLDLLEWVVEHPYGRDPVWVRSIYSHLLVVSIHDPQTAYEALADPELLDCDSLEEAAGALVRNARSTVRISWMP
jgi:hypothetical protein